MSPKIAHKFLNNLTEKLINTSYFIAEMTLANFFECKAKHILHCQLQVANKTFKNISTTKTREKSMCQNGR